ncbi:MAG: PHP domain-containing protein [Actinomycetota bacterium]|jgi:histidinol-phosphatase (PHP family)|nr:PHP domain-containing protein [Actinomycetota bacterium]
MIDYHLHLWPHSQRDVELAVDQVAAYCERAAAAGVVEIAITEHLFRFTQAVPVVGAFWDDDEISPSLKKSMAAYWDFHARADLDVYVETVLAAKKAGLPVVMGLEVDHYPGRMEQVAALLSGYPFDVLLGSIHWLGAWRFDDLDDPLSMAEWSVRDVDATWESYTRAIEELAASGTCDVLAHPDLVKVVGRYPGSPAEWWDRIAEAAAASNMAAELSSAGWRKPVAEQYPALPLLVRLAARGVPLTTASDAHRHEHVADRTEDLRAILDQLGVDHLQGYRRRQPHWVPLASPGLAGSAPSHIVPASEE